MEVSGQQHAPAALPPGKASFTHCIRGRVNPRAGLDDMEKWKSLPHQDSNSAPLVVMLVTSRCTDCAVIKKGKFVPMFN
jgi:hypothetical protein